MSASNSDISQTDSSTEVQSVSGGASYNRNVRRGCANRGFSSSRKESIANYNFNFSNYKNSMRNYTPNNISRFHSTSDLTDSSNVFNPFSYIYYPQFYQLNPNLIYLTNADATMWGNRHFMHRSPSWNNTGNSSIADREKQFAFSIRSWEHLGRRLQKFDLTSSFTFTVMSYNILAQELLTEHSYLYKHHNPRALLWEQRFPTLLDEIKYYNADILCLQEVQASHIEKYFNQLTKLGYNSLFKQRTGQRTDGCAIYYKTSVLDLVEYITVEFNQSNVAVLNRDNIAIVAKFTPKKIKNDFVVATTHLLYNPRRDDVRLAQTQVLLSEVDRLAYNSNSHGCNNSHDHVPVIITGDFNTKPESAIYKLITEGILKYEHLNNKSLSGHNVTTPTGKLLLPSFLRISDQCQHADLVQKRKTTTLSRDEELNLIQLQHSGRTVQNDSVQETNKSLFSTGTLSHDLALTSVYDHRSQSGTEATTYQDRWITVDYIFYSGIKNKQGITIHDKLKLIRRSTLPTAEALEGVKIPNYGFGSDHISLVAQFQLDL